MVATNMDDSPADEPRDGGEEEALWQRFRMDGDMQARSSLVELYDPLARQIAARLYAGRPDDTIEFADYRQYARLGLIEALDRYQPGSEASFSTYASYRIRGAVLNGLTHENERREQGAWRARLKRERLESLGHDAGSDKETGFEYLVQVAVGLALGYMLEDSGLIREDSAVARETPYSINEYDEICSRLAEAVDALPAREAFILKSHYLHEVDFSAIAELLDLSKGRVSQLHKRALEQLRAHLTGLGINQCI